MLKTVRAKIWQIPVSKNNKNNNQTRTDSILHKNIKIKANVQKKNKFLCVYKESPSYLFGLIGPSLELDNSAGGVSPFRLNSCMHLSLTVQMTKQNSKSVS